MLTLPRDRCKKRVWPTCPQTSSMATLAKTFMKRHEWVQTSVKNLPFYLAGGADEVCEVWAMLCEKRLPCAMCRLGDTYY